MISNGKDLKSYKQTARPGGHEGRKVRIMYRVYRVYRDNAGNIFHKVPVGCARTERSARALIAGQWGECIIEKIK